MVVDINIVGIPPIGGLLTCIPFLFPSATLSPRLSEQGWWAFRGSSITIEGNACSIFDRTARDNHRPKTCSTQAQAGDGNQELHRAKEWSS